MKAQTTTDKTSTATGGNGRAKSRQSVPTISPETAAATSGELTFLTSEGETLTFPDTGLSPGDAAAIAGEEALRKIWDRPAEDAAWRDM